MINDTMICLTFILLIYKSTSNIVYYLLISKLLTFFQYIKNKLMVYFRKYYKKGHLITETAFHYHGVIMNVNS